MATEEPLPDPSLAVRSEAPPLATPLPAKIRYEVGVEDLVAFNRYHVATTTALRTGAVYWVTNLVLGIGVGVALLFDETRFYAAAFFAGVITLAYVSQVTLGSRVKNLYKEGENRGIFCWHELEVDGDELVGRSPVVTFRMAIYSIERIVFRPAHTFIYYSAVGAYVVPHQKITDGDYETFRAALVRAWDKHHPDVSRP